MGGFEAVIYDCVVSSCLICLKILKHGIIIIHNYELK